MIWLVICPIFKNNLPLVLAGEGPSVEVLRVCQHSFLPLKRAVLLLPAPGMPAGGLVANLLPFSGLVCSGADNSGKVRRERKQ